MCEKAEEKKWTLEIVNERTDKEWQGYLPVHEISERFAEVIQRYSGDAYVNSYRRL